MTKTKIVLISLTICFLMLSYKKRHLVYTMKYMGEIYFNVRTASSNDKNDIRELIKGCFLIAHAGGGIDGHKYTNSLQAVNKAIADGHRLVELDLIKTSDDKIVAVHDWLMFNSMTQSDPESAIPNLYDVQMSKIYDKYDTLSINDIIDIFSRNKKLILVTDKIRDIETLSQLITFKDRTIVEVFNITDYNKAINNNFHNVALNIDINKHDIFKWITLNNIQSVTYRGDSLENLGAAYENALKISKSGVQALIYSRNDLNLRFVHDDLHIKNSALYVDYYSDIQC